MIHSQADVDELFFVLEGEIEIMADGLSHQVNSGGRLFVRRTVPHAFINRTNHPARMLRRVLSGGRPTCNGGTPPTTSR
ncbi:cupin domain-containing protein [Serratia ureilytica]|uniref:cupin domain-containing protein n=1 Tax=Serratia ureilytica TaxID=300181 RepID=UPI00396A1DE2|nr:cupin domain-containing protein [Serratia ureilytica]